MTYRYITIQLCPLVQSWGGVSAIAALVDSCLDCLLLPRDLALYRHWLPKGQQAAARKVYEGHIDMSKDLPIYKGQNPMYVNVYSFKTRHQLDFRYCSLFLHFSSNIFPRLASQYNDPRTCI